MTHLLYSYLGKLPKQISHSLGLDFSLCISLAYCKYATVKMDSVQSREGERENKRERERETAPPKWQDEVFSYMIKPACDIKPKFRVTKGNSLEMIEAINDRNNKTNPDNENRLNAEKSHTHTKRAGAANNNGKQFMPGPYSSYSIIISVLPPKFTLAARSY